MQQPAEAARPRSAPATAHFGLVIGIDDMPAWYVTIAVGAEGIQHGLVLCPGGAVP